MCEHLHLIRFEFFAAFQDNIFHERACFTLTDSEIRLCEELLSFLIWENLPLIHLSPTQFWFKFSGSSPTQYLWGCNPGFTPILRRTILDFPSLKLQSGGSEGHAARDDNKDTHTHLTHRGKKHKTSFGKKKKKSKCTHTHTHLFHFKARDHIKCD